MAELKCPHCGQAFTVDDTEFASIVKQVRDAEFEKDLNSRVSELEKHLNSEHQLMMEKQKSDIILKTKEEYEKEIQKLKDKLLKEEGKSKDLANQLESAEDKKELAVLNAVREVEEQKKDVEAALNQEKEKHEQDT